MDDEELLKKARQLDGEDWTTAARLARMAESDEIKQEIERLARWYYHNEEYRNGDN